ncbi:MAG: hypothetical protein WHW07_11435 [Bacteroidales bacterium]|jgi:hypothetical protein|nr:hypothetical protein [Bacteroidales bacterium]HPD23522.1 hypothetical protein [Bacteroidales bacterium]HRS99172.1 hypothetical protein [Bacteroidales bacterium]HRT79781.1 hypothetical protein [Bacteroidales bacterium]
MKNLVFVIILLISTLLLSCKNSSKKIEEESSCCKTEQSEICKDVMSVGELNKNVEAYIDKEVAVCGFCSHICSHSGNNLFLEEKDNPDELIICKTGEKIEKFDKNLENQHVVVKGILRAVKETEGEEAEVHHNVKVSYYIEVSDATKCSCNSKCKSDKDKACCSKDTQKKCCKSQE